MILASNQEQVNKSIEKISSEYKLESSDIIKFDGLQPDFNINEVFQELLTVSMFEESKFIHLINLPFLTSKSSLADRDVNLFNNIIEKLDSNVFLVFSFTESAIDSRKKLIKTIKKHAKWIEHKQESDLDIKSLINYYIQKHNLEMNVHAIALLNQYCKNSFQVKQAFEKLSLYDKQIDETIIKNLVTDSRIALKYDLSDAILLRNSSLAFKIFSDLKKQLEDPSDVIFILASKVRLIYQILVFDMMRIKEDEVLKRLKINPNYFWFLKNKQAQLFTLNSSLKLLKDLSLLDQKVKTSQIEKHLGFEMWMIEYLR